MILFVLKTTEQFKKYWARRKIDWKKSYSDTADHPHRFVISGILKTFNWLSLIEIGCGSGANIINIVKTIGGRQLGGIDINPDAIELASKTFQGGLFKVGSADDIMMSDKSTDVVLSDMCLIYVGPLKIKKYLREIKRITRNYVLFCEFHHESWWQRQKLRLFSGYHAYNWRKLFEKEGFYDILVYKLTESDWPGGQPQKDFAWIFLAKVPKR